MKIGTKQTLIPVISHRPSYSLGYRLLNTVGDASTILIELRVGLVLSTRRGKSTWIPAGCLPSRSWRWRGDDGDLGLGHGGVGAGRSGDCRLELPFHNAGAHRLR